MGQIAACLTDLICLIEQRDAFGFTSPSKAADSASVKKEGGKKKKGKRKSPYNTYSAVDTPTQTHENARARAHHSSFWRIYLFALNVLFIALPPKPFQVISLQQRLRGCKICQLSLSLIRNRTRGRWWGHIGARPLRNKEQSWSATIPALLQFSSRLPKHHSLQSHTFICSCFTILL